MPFMLWRKESVAGRLWLVLNRRIFELTAYLCYLGVSGSGQELTLPTMLIYFSLVRQDSTFMGIFLLLSSHLPKTICLGEGPLIHEILLCKITISPVFHHCHFDIFSPYIHASLLYQVEQSSDVEACSHPTFKNNIASVAHINV